MRGDPIGTHPPRRRTPHPRGASARLALRLVVVGALAALAGCAGLPPADGPATDGENAAATEAEPGTAAPGRAAPALLRKAGYPSLAPLMRRVTPAVVDVAVTAVVPVEAHPFMQDPDFRRFVERFGVEVPEEGGMERRESVGAGVVVDARRGYVLTDLHLLEGATEIEVRLKDRRSYRARLLGSDRGTDLAVLQIPAQNLRPIPFGDSDRLEVGDIVIAIGNPFGLGQTVTSGIVSAVGRKDIGDSRLGELVQTDASINPGNSGGPLLNLAGEIVGINTALIGPAGGNVGIGFAVPGNRARAALNRVLGRLPRR